MTSLAAAALVLPLLQKGEAVRAQESDPLASISVRTPKGWVHAVQADLPSGRVAARVALAPRLLPARALISQHQPCAAITGSFFSWETQKPVAEVLLNGQLAASGRRGSVLAFRWSGEAEILDPGFERTFDWAPYRWGLRGGVRLMKGGKVNPDPKAQRFRDPAIWGRAPRTGAGITERGKLILAATARAMTLTEFGLALKSLGAVEGVSFDGGGSTMLYRTGEMVIPTSRPLCCLITLHRGRQAPSGGSDPFAL
jgi:hypothetical protein